MCYNASEASFSFSELQWDTEFFGLSCAKAVLHRTLTEIEWKELKKRFADYRFVSIENRNSQTLNARYIGSDTTAFLADVNVQFQKKLNGLANMPKYVQIYQGMEYNEQILQLANFPFSKFTEDPELEKRGGPRVYWHWLRNSFGNNSKIYAVSKRNLEEIDGFVLFSYTNKRCIIELIAVSGNAAESGIGTDLFHAVEYTAYQRGCDEILVGTQIKNIPAMNFYHKVGCKQYACHQIYHLWTVS